MSGEMVNKQWFYVLVVVCALLIGGAIALGLSLGRGQGYAEWANTACAGHKGVRELPTGDSHRNAVCRDGLVVEE